MFSFFYVSNFSTITMKDSTYITREELNYLGLHITYETPKGMTK
jgi:hypothetical protein